MIIPPGGRLNLHIILFELPLNSYMYVCDAFIRSVIKCIMVL